MPPKGIKWLAATGRGKQSSVLPIIMIKSKNGLFENQVAFLERFENLSFKADTEALVIVVFVVVVRHDRVGLGREREPGFEVRPLLQLVQVLLSQVQLSGQLGL